MRDREDYDKKQCLEAADSLYEAGGVYKYVAAAIRYSSLIGDKVYYEIREDNKLIAIRETMQEADSLIEKLAFTNKKYLVVEVDAELMFRNKGDKNDN